jgi:hypothetical protein
MKTMTEFRNWMVPVVAVCICGFGFAAAAEEQTPSQAGEQVGVEGTFVRVAENDEGYVIVGYEIANESVGKEWMLLEIGMTVMKGTEAQKITRDDIKLVTPKKEVLSLPTQEEFEKVRGDVLPLAKRAAMVGDSINYFPPAADSPCQIQLFAPLVGPRVVLAEDDVELSSNRACVGEVYFKVPGGIEYGLYNLDVVFANSILKLPLQIMSKEEAKEFTKKWKEELKEERHHDHHEK